MFQCTFWIWTQNALKLQLKRKPLDNCVKVCLPFGWLIYCGQRCVCTRILRKLLKRFDYEILLTLKFNMFLNWGSEQEFKTSVINYYTYTCGSLVELVAPSILNVLLFHQNTKSFRLENLFFTFSYPVLLVIIADKIFNLLNYASLFMGIWLKYVTANYNIVYLALRHLSGFTILHAVLVSTFTVFALFATDLI